MDLITLAQTLIKQPSVTPDDHGCQTIMADCLKNLGFTITDVSHKETRNFWAYLPADKHSVNTDAPLFIFAGHTDVVPPGDLSQWTFDPFSATIENGCLHGRGSVDMKSGLAVMLISTQKFLQQLKQNQQTRNFHLGFMITSDEEGPAKHGTIKICEYLQQANITPHYCLVGEPSSIAQTGDQIRIGRRGSLTGKLTVHGKQGHVAYPDLALNAIDKASEIITRLKQTQWDNGNVDFPPTSLQFTHIQSSTNTNNIIPGTVNLNFNLRFSPETSAKQLQQQITQLITDQYSNITLDWQHSGDPFYTPPENSLLIKHAQKVITQHLKQPPVLSTGGGTSDGRFIAHFFPQTEIIELGLPNKTIHAVNEHCELEQLEHLAIIYQEILLNLNTAV